MKRKWKCVEMSCRPEAADELAAILAEAFDVGVEVLAGGVRLYLPEDYFLEKGKQKLESILNGFQPVWGGLPAVSSQVLSTLEEEDWLAQWKRDFKPLRVGKQLVIAPTWEELTPLAGEWIIRIDPGQAFGTGHHETTRLCLEWLEAQAGTASKGSSKSLLDVGTGTGILAIAAALLGCDPIVALDSDPEAIQVARENFELNGVSRRIALQVGTVEAVAGNYDIVLANIQAVPLIEMASQLADRLARSGRIVLSGILLEQAAMVQSACEAQDMKLLARREAGEWCLLEFSRRQGRPE